MRGFELLRRTSELLSVAGALVPRPCEEIPHHGDRLHDGFFAGVRGGAAVLFAHVETTPNVAPFRTRVRGVGQSAELALGATPWSGIVLGGSIWTARIDPVFVERGRTVSPDDDSVKVTQARIGPFLDWYPAPRRGFHAMASVAFALGVESDVKGNPIEPPSLGAAFSIGSGYEWFVGSEFSLGFVGRIALAEVERRYGGADEWTLSVVPELAISYTYH